MGALLELVRARRQERAVEISDDMSDDEGLRVLSRQLSELLSDLESELERPVARGHEVTKEELEDLHAKVIDWLGLFDAMERRERDAAAGIVYQVAAPMVRPEPKTALPPPSSPSPAVQKPQRRRRAEPASLDLGGIKLGYISHWDSRGACGVAELAGGGGEVVIPVAATLAGGFTNFLIGQAIEFKIVLGGGRMETETGSLKIARASGGPPPAKLSGLAFARKRYFGVR